MGSNPTLSARIFAHPFTKLELPRLCYSLNNFRAAFRDARFLLRAHRRCAAVRSSIMRSVDGQIRRSSRTHSFRLRAIAGVLLAFFFLPFLLPFCNVNSEAALPACCRRDGKHHCAMFAHTGAPGIIASTGPIARAATPDCPYRSRLLMPLVWRTLFVHRAPVFSIPTASSAALRVRTILIAQRCEFGSHRKRGPPSLLV